MLISILVPSGHTATSPAVYQSIQIIDARHAGSTIFSHLLSSFLAVIDFFLKVSYIAILLGGTKKQVLN